MVMVLLLWTLLYFGFNLLFEHNDGLGDIFNAISSLFAGLAFAGIIYTIYLQSEELSLQRKELADTRKEFEIQNQTLKCSR